MRPLSLPSDAATGALGPAPDHVADVYSIHVTARTGVQVVLPRGTTLRLRARCGDPAGEVVRAGSSHCQSSPTHLRQVVDPGDYDLVVQGTSPYALALSSFAEPPGRSCEAAPSLATDGSAQEVYLEDGVVQAERCGLTDHLWHFFALTVPAGQRAIVAVTPPRGTVSLMAFDRCDEAGACPDVTRAVSNSNHDYEGVLGVSNPAATPRAVVVALAIAPDFDLNCSSQVSLMARLVPLAPNAACTGATPVTDGTLLRGEDTSATFDVCRADLGPASVRGGMLYYRATIPAASTLIVRGPYTDLGSDVPLNGYSGELRVVDGCAPPRCDGDPQRAPHDRGPGGYPFRLENPSDAPRAVTFALSQQSRTGARGYVFDVSAAVGGSPPNASCTGASPVRDGVALRGQDATFAFATSELAPCDLGGALPTLYYAADVPARATIEVTAARSSDAGVSVAVYVLSGCGGACLARPDIDARTSFTNDGASSRRVVLAVPDQFSDRTTFDLRVAVRPAGT